jgi:hypothetical protein
MIDRFGDLLQHNLLVFAALILLPLKWIIVRLCKDTEAEVATIISLPEDMCYIGIGLVLGDMVNNSGAFRKHFSHSQHISIDMLITVFINFFVAVGVHLLAQKGSEDFKSWRAANSVNGGTLLQRLPQQMELPLTVADSNVTFLTLGHLFEFCILYIFQMAIVVFWFHWIARIVQGT